MNRSSFRFNGRSIVLTWLLSYLIILLLPMIIGVLVYFESNKTLEEEIHKANDALLKQIREIMDNQFKAMEQLNFEIMWNVRMQELLYSNKYQSNHEEYLYDGYQISRDLKLYKTSYPLVDLFYVYLNKDNSVILPGTVREGPFAYETLHQTDKLTYSEWHSIVSKEYFKGFIPMYRINDNDQLKPTAAYISSYPSEKGEPIATNVLMIDQSRILGAIQNSEIFNQGHVLILNKDNQVLVSNSDFTLPNDFPYGKIDDSSTFFYMNHEDEEYEVFYIQSPQSGLKYISLIPSSLYWEKAEHVRNLTYISMAMSLVGGTILMVFFLRRNYHPVRRLVQAFAKKAPNPSRKAYNEFRFIQEAVDSTLHEVDNFRLKIEQQRHIIRSNFIGRLLKGKLDSQVPIDEALTTFDMRFETQAFAVILFVVEESEAFFKRFEHMQEGDQWKLLHFIIGNVAEEVASQNHLGYVAEIDETLACLINFTTENEQGRKEELLRIAREVQKFLATTYDIGLTIAISSVNEHVAGISKAFNEALDAMEYKLVMGQREILAYEEIQTGHAKDASNDYYFPLQVEQQLMNYVKLGEFEKAKSLLDEIIETNFLHSAVSVPLARCLMLDLVSTMIKTISESGDMQESLFVHNPKQMERLISSPTIQDMQSQLTDILLKVCEYTLAKRQHNMQHTRQRVLQELVEQVKSYIEANYKDSNLNVTMIGNHFDRKATYLSKLFKDYTEEGLLDYINKVRIE
jgi:two-component system response regulator YesN